MPPSRGAETDHVEKRMAFHSLTVNLNHGPAVIGDRHDHVRALIQCIFESVSVTVCPVLLERYRALCCDLPRRHRHHPGQNGDPQRIAGQQRMKWQIQTHEPEPATALRRPAQHAPNHTVVVEGDRIFQFPLWRHRLPEVVCKREQRLFLPIDVHADSLPGEPHDFTINAEEAWLACQRVVLYAVQVDQYLAAPVRVGSHHIFRALLIVPAEAREHQQVKAREVVRIEIVNISRRGIISYVAFLISYLLFFPIIF